MEGIEMTGDMTLKAFLMNSILQMSSQETDTIEISMDLPDRQSVKFSLQLVEVNGQPIV